MTTLKKLLFLFVIIFFYSCSQSADQVTMSELRSFDSGETPPGPDIEKKQEPVSSPDEAPEEAVTQKLIREGTITFETASMAKTAEVISHAIKQYNGYVSAENGSTFSDRISNTTTIRVPVENFDSLLSAATRGIKDFDTKEITVKDVTDEYVDIQARLKTKKEMEHRYQELLQKANTVKDILEIEQQSGKLRADIESIEGRLRYLQNQVSYSTLTVTYYEIIPRRTAFMDSFKSGFRNGWNNFIYFLVVLANLWTFILIGIIAILGIRYYRKKKRGLHNK